MFRPRPDHHQCTPDDGRVTAETYVGLIEYKYENKNCIRWLNTEN
jgi:hypothetical protein